MSITETVTEERDDLQALRIDRSRPNRDDNRGPRRALIITLVLVVVAVAVFVVSRLNIGDRLGLVPAEVQVVIAARKGPSGSQPVLSASGYLIARHQVEVGSKITGRVVSLEVKEGDPITKGQVIARLDSLEVTAQLRQAEANLAAAKARLAEAEAGSRTQEIDRSKAEVARSEADLKNAELALKRAERLSHEGVLDRQSLDNARSRYDIAEAAHRSAKESYELVRIGPRREQIDLSRAQVRQAEAEVALAQAQVDNTIIRAPVSGLVLDRYVDLGEMVTTGFTSDRGAKQALVAIADINDLQVEMDIAEADIAKVVLDQPAGIVPDAYADHQYKGSVEYIAAVGDRQKATIKVKVKVFDPDQLLRPDMSAKVTFFEKGSAVPQERAVVTLPRTTVVQQNGNAVVFLVRDSKVAVQQVSLGKEEGGYVEILSGLQGGENVIISGQSSLKEGANVTVGR